ncbi:HNH endonuclease [Micromonospora tulbaghiae]|uniref:HNH endonuclease n=1 Tax=Micromonospora tulbaghiae TaxID=479978 RepID=UPI0033F1EBD5
MAERTISVVCRDCGTTFGHTKRGNKPKLLCPPCVLEAQRKATREHKRRKRAAAKVVYTHCPFCGGEYDEPRSRNGRCVGCRREYTREAVKRWKARQPNRPRESRCVRCNTATERTCASGRILYCPPCGEAAKKESIARAEANRKERRGAKLSTHCHYCGGELPRPYYSGKRPARCLPCKRQRQYAYMRSRTTQARANATCIDCCQPVHAKRKGPRRPRCAACRIIRQREIARVHAAVHGHARRAKMRGAEAEKFTKQSIFDRDGWRCGICCKRIPRHLTHPHSLSASLDHIIPLSKGGPHTRANTRASHLRCNLKRSNRFTSEQLALFG